MVDNLLKLCYMGWRPYLRKPWHRTYLIISALHALDLLLLLAGAGRPMRPFRGLTLLLRARSLRKMSTAIMEAGPVVALAVSMLSCLLLLYAAVGARVFGRSYRAQALGAADVQSTGAFDDTLTSLSTTFQL